MRRHLGTVKTLEGMYQVPLTTAELDYVCNGSTSRCDQLEWVNKRLSTVCFCN